QSLRLRWRRRLLLRWLRRLLAQGLDRVWTAVGQYLQLLQLRLLVAGSDGLTGVGPQHCDDRRQRNSSWRHGFRPYRRCPDTKATFRDWRGMSALPLGADIRTRPWPNP